MTNQFYESANLAARAPVGYTYSIPKTIDGKPISIELWETACHEDMDRIRPLSYPNTKVFLICFSLDSFESFNNVSSKWVPEIKLHCKGVPIILIGAKMDLRETKDSNHLVTYENGLKMMKEINAIAYIECSSLIGKAGNYEWGEETYRSKKNIICKNGQEVKISYSKNIDYDMEIYFDPDLRNVKERPQKLPSAKVPRILYSAESYRNSICPLDENCAQYFNWTYIAASDADIHFMYYSREKVASNFLNTSESFEIERDVMKKKRSFKEKYINKDNKPEQYPLVNWMALNCDTKYSNRVEYIKKMMELIPVHSVGKCLNNYELEENKDGRQSDVSFNSKREIISRYKFYFSFENSLCRGYFTEKIFHCYEAGTVPIVMMHPDTLEFLPRGSYIYVGDFNSAKELADYLIFLDENDEEYQKYFRWRTNERVIRKWMEKINDFEHEECEIARLYNQWHSGNYIKNKQVHKYKSSECLSKDYHPI
eukprot:gene1320-1666_t